MALALLCLGLTLLGTLPTKAQDSSRDLIPSPPLSKIPLKPGFQHSQFKGNWYVIGVAGNAIQKGKGRDTMYRDTYELKSDKSFNVTSTLLRGQICDHWIRTFVPGDKPGEFNLGDRPRHLFIQSYTVRVTATDYTQFATVFFMKTSRNKEYFKINLYGRTKELSPELKQHFVGFAKSLGLSDDNINFLQPIAKCIDS